MVLETCRGRGKDLGKDWQQEMESDRAGCRDHAKGRQAGRRSRVPGRSWGVKRGPWGHPRAVCYQPTQVSNGEVPAYGDPGVLASGFRGGHRHPSGGLVPPAVDERALLCFLPNNAVTLVAANLETDEASAAVFSSR